MARRALALFVRFVGVFLFAPTAERNGKRKMKNERVNEKRTKTRHENIFSNNMLLVNTLKATSSYLQCIKIELRNSKRKRKIEVVNMPSDGSN